MNENFDDETLSPGSVVHARWDRAESALGRTRQRAVESDGHHVVGNHHRRRHSDDDDASGASLGERKKRRDAMNAITRAVGHARVRMGTTEVVCAISGRIASSDEKHHHHHHHREEDEDEEEDKEEEEEEEEDALLLFTIGQKRKEKDEKATRRPGDCRRR